MTFTEREDRACEVTDALARWLLEEHLSLDEGADPSVQADCPICGGPVRYDSPQQADLEIRELRTRRGKIEYERAARRCGRCQKVFFYGGKPDLRIPPALRSRGLEQFLLLCSGRGPLDVPDPGR